MKTHKPRTVTVVLTATLPPSTTRQAFRDHVQTEARASFGGLHPDDPLFDTDRGSIVAALPQKHARAIIDRIMRSHILRRQAVAALQANPMTKEWFE